MKNLAGVLATITFFSITHGQVNDVLWGAEVVQLLKDFYINSTILPMVLVHRHDGASFDHPGISVPVEHINIIDVLECTDIFPDHI